MRNTTSVALAFGLGLALLSGVADAQVSSLQGGNLGQHWYGPEYTMDDLKGRVVMVEAWGYN